MFSTWQLCLFPDYIRFPIVFTSQLYLPNDIFFQQLLFPDYIDISQQYSFPNDVYYFPTTFTFQRYLFFNNFYFPTKYFPTIFTSLRCLLPYGFYFPTIFASQQYSIPNDFYLPTIFIFQQLLFPD